MILLVEGLIYRLHEKHTPSKMTPKYDLPIGGLIISVALILMITSFCRIKTKLMSNEVDSRKKNYIAFPFHSNQLRYTFNILILPKSICAKIHLQRCNCISINYVLGTNAQDTDYAVA